MNQENKHIFQNNDDLFSQDNIVFQEEEVFADEVEPVALPEEVWEVMIIDDEEDVHQLTRFVLEDYVYEGRKLKFTSAYSAKEAKILIQQHPNVAVILLDVVMETSDAGLKLVEYIREQQHNRFARIILRTGQPGYAPEKQIILKYDINDYKNKTELTDQKLFTVITASLRAWQHLEEKVVERTHELQQKNEVLVNLNQQLTQLNQDKNEFLAIAAHDLKNPLAFDDFPKQKTIEFAQMIEISAHKMFALIKNLLDVNAIESNQMNLSVNAFNILLSLQTVINNYVEPAKAKEIVLECEFSQAEYKALVDENATYQVLDNLISNAVKYSPRGKNIYIRLFKTENVIRCEIQDEGLGLSEADQAKLFGKFVRLTPRPSGDEHSTGLGLFIVKKLVHAMNSKVWCESQLGKGSTFIVEFPI